MASSIIHIAVANEIGKKINRDTKELLIGSIVPDISKLIGKSKIKSHFLDKDNNIPNLEKFKNKYKNSFNDDFVLGYFIHLYTDYLWFKYFMPELNYKGILKDLDGNILECNEEGFYNLIYNDYTNLNISIIEEYNLNLKLFYEDIPKIKPIIDEIPMEQINLIINKAGIIIENSIKKKNVVFNLENIKKFIDLSVKIILSELEKNV